MFDKPLREFLRVDIIEEIPCHATASISFAVTTELALIHCDLKRTRRCVLQLLRYHSVEMSVKQRYSLR